MLQRHFFRKAPPKFPALAIKCEKLFFLNVLLGFQWMMLVLYDSIFVFEVGLHGALNLVLPEGLSPPASAFEARCSIH